MAQGPGRWKEFLRSWADRCPTQRAMASLDNVLPASLSLLQEGSRIAPNSISLRLWHCSRIEGLKVPGLINLPKQEGPVAFVISYRICRWG